MNLFVAKATHVWIRCGKDTNKTTNKLFRQLKSELQKQMSYISSFLLDASVCQFVCNLTCPKPDKLIRTGAPAGTMEGQTTPFHFQLELKACPAMPHSVSMQACFALSRGNQPALKQEDRTTASLCLQPVIKTHSTSPQSYKTWVSQVSFHNSDKIKD